MKVAACGKWFDYLNMMPLQEGLILERLVEEYSDTEVFQNFENISVDTDLICLDADHTNYSILIQLAKKGVNVLCQGLWNVENYLDVIREFKRNNKFVIEDESFLNFEKVSIFVDIAKKLLAFDPAAEIEIKTNCFNIYAAVRILGMFLPNMQQMTVEQHVEQDSKESKKVEYAMMKRQKKFSIYVRKIPTLVIGSYNDQCVILQAVKDNAKIHTAELKIVDSVCHDMMLDPDWRNIADLIFKFIEKTIDKKSGDNYNDNYVSTQAHQGGE